MWANLDSHTQLKCEWVRIHTWFKKWSDDETVLSWAVSAIGARPMRRWWPAIGQWGYWICVLACTGQSVACHTSQASAKVRWTEPFHRDKSAWIPNISNIFTDPTPLCSSSSPPSNELNFASTPPWLAIFYVAMLFIPSLARIASSAEQLRNK